MSTQARPIDVANAAVTLLNSAPAQATFTLAPFTAVRDYLPLYDLESHVQGLIVTVMPAALDEAPIGRLTIGGKVALDVAVQNYVGNPPVVTSQDALMLLVEQIKTVLEKGLTLPEAALDCGWLATENDPIYEQEMLQEFSVFTSVPRFHFQVRRVR